MFADRELDATKYRSRYTVEYFRVWPHGDRRLYRLGIKVDYGGMDERYAMNKTNYHDSMIHAQL